MAKHSLKFRLEYFAVLMVSKLVRRVPRPIAIMLGSWLGTLAWQILRKRRRLAVENLRRAFPEFDRKQIRGLARANFIHVGISAVDMLRSDMFQPGSKDLERYFDLEGLEHMQKAHDLGRGVIMLSAHFGSWEVIHFPLNEFGFKVDPVAKPMKNPLVGELVTRSRETYGGKELNSRKGARRTLKSLQAGRIVAILLDQHISPPGSIPTRFFGRLGYTTTAITSMAMRYQIPIVPVFCQRLPSYRYKLWAEPMLLLEGEGEEAVNANTQLLTDIIESAVRQDITQWFWMHKRWRVPEDQPVPNDTGKDETGE